MSAPAVNTFPEWMYRSEQPRLITRALIRPNRVCRTRIAVVPTDVVHKRDSLYIFETYVYDFSICSYANKGYLEEKFSVYSYIRRSIISDVRKGFPEFFSLKLSRRDSCRRWRDSHCIVCMTIIHSVFISFPRIYLIDSRDVLDISNINRSLHSR